VKAKKGGLAHWFGERALLKKDVREATAQVVSPSCVCLALTRSHFEQLLGPLQELMLSKFAGKKDAGGAGSGGNAKLNAAAQKTLDAFNGRTKIEMSDLKRLGLLGCGGFGAVTLEKHKKTGECFALKALSKG
jgi:hypothetical protein